MQRRSCTVNLMIDISAGLSCVLNLTKKMLVKMASEDTRPAVNVISPEKK